VVSDTPWSLYSGNKQISFVEEAGWAPGPVWTGVGFSPPQSSSFRSESIYRLSYPGPRIRIVESIMENVGGSGRGLTGRYTRLINA